MSKLQAVRLAAEPTTQKVADREARLGEWKLKV